MIKNKVILIIAILFFLLPIAFLGCGGGGSDAPPPVPAIKVIPSTYDFGIVTTGNSPAPLEVEIANNGSAALNVSNITLGDLTNFSLDLSKGSSPCGKTSPTINPGKSCTGQVQFIPQSDLSFTTSLSIRSNDPNHPTVNLPLSGVSQPISELNVHINQVETCPGPVVTAYVSVTDQGGYPVTTLADSNFTITENSVDLSHPTASFVSGTATISVALVMDYSYSISQSQDNIDDMEESAANFVDQMKVGDEAEVIKFSDIWKVEQAFTSNKDDLKTAIHTFYPDGHTDLYDAIYKAVDDTAARSNDRRAVIVITDGGNDFHTYHLQDVIDRAKAKGVPIFTVGLGNIDAAILTQIADDTGGQYFEATTSDNLRTIHQQLAKVLFDDQYILEYTSGLGANVTADLTVDVTLGGATPGSDTKSITSCP